MISASITLACRLGLTHRGLSATTSLYHMPGSTWLLYKACVQARSLMSLLWHPGIEVAMKKFINYLAQRFAYLASPPVKRMVCLYCSTSSSSHPDVVCVSFHLALHSLSGCYSYLARSSCMVWKGSLLVQLSTLRCSTYYVERCFPSGRCVTAPDMLCASIICIRHSATSGFVQASETTLESRCFSW